MYDKCQIMENQITCPDLYVFFSENEQKVYLSVQVNRKLITLNRQIFIHPTGKSLKENYTYETSPDIGVSFIVPN